MTEDEFKSAISQEFSIRTWRNVSAEQLDVGEGTIVPDDRMKAKSVVTNLNRTQPGHWITERSARTGQKNAFRAIFRVDPVVFGPVQTALRNLRPGKELRVQFLQDFDVDFAQGITVLDGRVTFALPIPDGDLYRLRCLSNPFT